MEKMPREKMIEEGKEALRDDELLAIMLGTGSGHESVFDLSKRLLNDYGFKKLCTMNYQELSKIEGIKEAKATKLMAVFEIIRRISNEENKERRITGSKELFEYVRNDYFLLKKEMLTVIYTDSALRVLSKDTYTDDNYTQINVPLKKIIKNAVLKDCYGVFLVHNHPGGNPHPSDADRKYTYALDEALRNLGISLLDHIILSQDSYYSFSDSEAKNGLLFSQFR